MNPETPKPSQAAIDAAVSALAATLAGDETDDFIAEVYSTLTNTEAATAARAISQPPTPREGTL